MSSAIAATLIVKLSRPATQGRPALYLVFRDSDRLSAEPVGMLERFKETRTTRHPWKAYAGTGMASRFLGAAYDDSAREWFGAAGAGCAFGGQAAALAMIAAACGEPR